MSDQQDPAGYLISFLSSYTELVEKELQSIREHVVNTVEAVMNGVEGISEKTEQKRREVEQTLESTYLQPDAETEILMQDMQQIADDVFEKVSAEVESGGTAEAVSSSASEVVLRNRINRFSSKLAASQGRLSQVDDEVTNMVFGIIGSLSSEDVIVQRLEHVVLSLKSLQTGLSYILIDYEQRCKVEELSRVIKDIKTFTFRQFTTEDEKELFHSVFGEAG